MMKERSAEMLAHGKGSGEGSLRAPEAVLRPGASLAREFIANQRALMLGSMRRQLRRRQL